jgi:hypothetical protein
MRSFSKFIVSLAFVSFIVLPPPGQSDTAKESALKLQAGTYYWTGSAWSPMQQITMSGGGTKHAAKMFVPGLTPQVVWTFRDSTAPVQVTDARPQFCFKFYNSLAGTPYAPSGRDIVLVRFDQKKDHRELQTTNGGNMFTFKSGLSKDRMPDIDISAADASTFLVSPRGDLAPGEYLLSASTMGASGYDFGFHPR